MDHRTLFQVLVVGGALIGLACEERARGDADAAAPAADAGPTLEDGGEAPLDAGELEECGLCPNEACCVDDGAGGSRARDGFVCCWGSSC